MIHCMESYWVLLLCVMKHQWIQWYVDATVDDKEWNTRNLMNCWELLMILSETPGCAIIYCHLWLIHQWIVDVREGYAILYWQLLLIHHSIAYVREWYTKETQGIGEADSIESEFFCN